MRFQVLAICSVSFLAAMPVCYAQQKKYVTLGYRSCGTERGTCHQFDGNWWKRDPHFSTVKDLKRKKQKSLQFAQAYGMNPGDYLKGSSKCAQCHGEVVNGRENKNMNTGVSCENCHGPAGPKEVGYFEVHQEGALPQDPLDTSRTGYQKALRVGQLELRNVTVRVMTCVRCHQINERKLLETGHPTGEGFDYIKGIKNNISRHWDYKLRRVDLDEAPYNQAVQRKPIPQFVLASARIPGGPVVNTRSVTDTIVIYVDPELPSWLNPQSTVSLKSFDPQISEDAPVDSILLEIKKYIEYVHKTINQK